MSWGVGKLTTKLEQVINTNYCQTRITKDPACCTAGLKSAIATSIASREIMAADQGFPAIETVTSHCECTRALHNEVEPQ